jgi:hypothetical protein
LPHECTTGPANSDLRGEPRGRVWPHDRRSPRQRFGR